MKWHYIDEKQPTHSGQYLVVARAEIDDKSIQNIVFISEYAYQEGFSFDINMQRRNKPNRVYAWSEITPPPLHKESLARKRKGEL